MFEENLSWQLSWDNDGWDLTTAGQSSYARPSTFIIALDFNPNLNGCGTQAFNHSTEEAEKGDLHEFEFTLAYVASYRTARAMRPCLKQKSPKPYNHTLAPWKQSWVL